MSIHYLPNTRPSRTERLETLLARGVEFTEALKIVAMSRYELIQELRAKPRSQAVTTDAATAAPIPSKPLSAEIVTFPVCKSREPALAKSKALTSLRPPKAPANDVDSHLAPILELERALSFPDAYERLFDKKL